MEAVERPPKTRVLLVEDDEDCRRSLEMLLDEEGISIRTAHDGGEALEMLKQGYSPDVIVLDLMMPVVDGWQFLKTRAETKMFSDIPVIAISAMSYRGAPGAEAVLPKPIDSEALLRLIRELHARGARQRL